MAELPTSAHAQYFLELINRARLDPGLEVKRVAAEQGYPIGEPQSVSARPSQPLAPNDLLTQSALERSAWTKAYRWDDEATAPDPREAVQAHGYPLGDPPVLHEIANWFNAAMKYGEWYDATWFERSYFSYAPVRRQMLDPEAKEVGVGLIIDNYDMGHEAFWGRDAFLAYPTLHLAAPASNGSFITGVVYRDGDGNRFYTPGEGLGGIGIAVDPKDGGAGSTAASAPAGGYAAAVADGRYAVTFGGDGLAGPMSAEVAVAGQNVKLDVLGDGALASSTDIEAVSGVSYIKLLGYADVSARADADGATIHGNRGDNRLVGGDGNDRMNGGGGDDRMAGGRGDDLYVIDSTTDIVEEAAGEGTDTVHSTLAQTVLPENVELLFLVGNAAVGADGNALDNRMTGNELGNRLRGLDGNDRLAGKDGDDTLEGGAGDDRLTGGPGGDVFVFSSHLHGRDVVEDFDAASGDRLDLSGLMLELGLTGGGNAVLFEQHGADLHVRVETEGIDATLAVLRGVTAAELTEDALIW